MTTFGIFCLEARKILEGSEKDRFLRMPRWFAIVEFFLGHADAAFLSWHTAKVKVVKFKAALTIKKKSSLYQLCVETCCSGRETKKKKKEEKEEGKRRRRRRREEGGRGVFIFIVAPRLQVHLFVASSRTNKPTNSSFAFTCSFTSWQRCVEAMVAMVAKPIKVQGSVQHPHMVPTNPKKKSFNHVSPSSRLQRPDFSLRLHAVRMDRNETTNCDEPGFQTSYRKPRWHAGWSWAIFFYYPRFVDKKRRFSEIHESSSL